jgi:hypothetical protein
MYMTASSMQILKKFQIKWKTRSKRLHSNTPQKLFYPCWSILHFERRWLTSSQAANIGTAQIMKIENNITIWLKERKRKGQSSYISLTFHIEGVFDVRHIHMITFNRFNFSNYYHCLCMMYQYQCGVCVRAS